MNLKEYFILKSSFEHRANDSFLSTLHNTMNDLYNGTTSETSNLKMISLDDVTSYMFNTFEKYGNAWKSKKLDTAKDYKNKLEEVRDLINERARLDSYFNVTGFKIELIRIYMLKLIIKLQNEGFVREINRLNSEMNYDYPQIEDILLRMFVSCVREFDDYYKLNLNSGKSILVNNSWEVPKLSESEFHICKVSGNRLNGFIGTQKFEKSFDFEGVFSAMVLFVYQIKKSHNVLNSRKTNAFSELVKNFDITDERYLDFD